MHEGHEGGTCHRGTVGDRAVLVWIVVWGWHSRQLRLLGCRLLFAVSYVEEQHYAEDCERNNGTNDTTDDSPDIRSTLGIRTASGPRGTR